MMLPFLTGAISIWCGIRGRRQACIGFWLLTIVIFGLWSRFHMTDPLALSL
jgi:hypothetical protein